PHEYGGPRGPYADLGSNAGNWFQPESPPPPGAPMGGVCRCERCGRLGHQAKICATPRRFEGTCGCCKQYGHMKRYCLRNPHANPPSSRPHANVLLSGSPSGAGVTNYALVALPPSHGGLGAMPSSPYSGPYGGSAPGGWGDGNGCDVPALPQSRSGWGADGRDTPFPSPHDGDDGNGPDIPFHTPHMMFAANRAAVRQFT
ncbi:unnamed protein product, partial [Scytosiphon promiscuus]